MVSSCCCCCCCCNERPDPNAPKPVMTPRQVGAMDRLVKLTDFMDISCFTICGRGIGFDGILGFILPEVGDVITAIIALYTMSNIFCHFNQVFRRHCLTMFMNIGIDLLIGLIPFAGDLCDVYWHSYEKNTDLVRKFYGLEPLAEMKKLKADAAAAAAAAAATPGNADVESGASKPNEGVVDPKLSKGAPKGNNGENQAAAAVAVTAKAY